MRGDAGVRIVFVGAGFGNRGAEAMIRGTLRSLRSVMPDAEFVVASHADEDVSRAQEQDLIVVRNDGARTKLLRYPRIVLHRLVPIGWLRRWPFEDIAILQELSAADAVIDLSGFAFTDEFGWKGALLYACEILRAKLLGISFIVYPQSMGPFNGRLVRALARMSLSHADLIMVRDEASKDYLEQLGLGTRDIHVCADSAFLLEPAPAARALEILEIHGIPHDESNLIGITPNMKVYDRSEGAGQENRYVGLLCEFIGHIRGHLNAEVILIPCEFIHGKQDDGWLVKEVLQAVSNMSGVYALEGEYTAAELKAIIGRLEVLIASRFHSALASLSMGVPTIVLAWAHKYSALMRAMDQQRYVLDYQDATLEQLEGMLDRMWARRAEIRGQLPARVSQAEQSARGAALLAKHVMVAHWQSTSQKGFGLGRTDAD